MQKTIFCESQYDYLRRFEVSKPQEIRDEIYQSSEKRIQCFIHCLNSCTNLLEICNLFDSSFYKDNWSLIVDCLKDSYLNIQFQFENYKITVCEDNYITMRQDGNYITKFNSFKEMKEFLKLL